MIDVGPRHHLRLQRAVRDLAHRYAPSKVGECHTACIRAWQEAGGMVQGEDVQCSYFM